MPKCDFNNVEITGLLKCVWPFSGHQALKVPDFRGATSINSLNANIYFF